MKQSKKNGKIDPAVKDVRIMRPIVVRELSTNRGITIQQIDSATVDGCEISYPSPNNVALFASIAKKELQQARNIYASVIGKQIKGKKRLEISTADVPRLYNYFESIQSSVISIYTALESFANIAIPRDYIYTFKNNKGVTESWDKNAIERWQKTSDKLSILLPDILKCESPKSIAEWSSFKELETIRNDIIHQKTLNYKDQDQVDSHFIKKLLTPRIFEVVESGFSLISFFCQKNTSHNYFPLGFGEAKVEPLELENFEDQFELVRSAGEDEPN
jgi:hypothetical protein